ncbi:DNA recombination protein RmuC [Harryflintia acetispora]|uniref:DNA recombination protein RmuC n=1 Tax=Harryflintia acetispora TaxID=1849041 RepID=A0A9X8Y886_9FIRM|nr:DNA recombination protein RmuC [Harryflintia acetispora]TCL43458.1 DNA recombination protein RmuC [Harryflintia acetispora]
MTIETILLICLLAVSAAALVVSILALRRGRGDGYSRQLEAGQRELRQELLSSVQGSVQSLGELVAANQRTAAEAQNERLAAFERSLAARQEALQSSLQSLGELIAATQSRTAQLQNDRFGEIDGHLLQKQDALARALALQFHQFEERFGTFSLENAQRLEEIRASVEKRLSYLQEDNNRKLDEMRRLVDEKLQKTLEERVTRSFQLVSEKLQEVYQGLGEMRNLAVGVGDLKKVLSNVKTRGILGEVQLGAILEEILAPGQYARNVATRHDGKNYVEYAVKLPAEDGGHIWLPIDSKFPADAYAELRESYENGTPEQVNAALSVLQSRIKSFAKDIRDKYIDPPYTTEFGIMFLPFEGLYAEVVSRGMVETLQHEYKVNVAGPSTMAALLNSLQMGFRTFAIQQRSGEVWKVLGAVKTEFDKFGGVLLATQKRLEQANHELDQLVGVRTRQIQRTLKDVTSLQEDQAGQVFARLPEEEATAAMAEE